MGDVSQCHLPPGPSTSRPSGAFGSIRTSPAAPTSPAPLPTEVTLPDDLPAPREGEALIYATPDGGVRVEVLFGAETFWLTLRRMAELFGVDVRTVSKHLGHIFATGELDPEATVRRVRTVQREGAPEVACTLDHYNLDAVISVGYRVNSRQATHFRIWATRTLREFMVKGYVLDDERLKQGQRFDWTRSRCTYNG